MDAHDQAAIVQMFFSLALIAFSFGFMRRRTRVDRYRERLFTLRDELFDYMWKNDIPFDLAAYRMIRSSLNTAIRVAGEMRPTTVLLVMLTVGRHPPEPTLSVAIDAIEDDDIRAHFQRTIGDSVDASLKFMRYFTLILWSIDKFQRLRRAVRPLDYHEMIIHELVTFRSEKALLHQSIMSRRSSLTSRL